MGIPEKIRKIENLHILFWLSKDFAGDLNGNGLEC